MSRNQMAFAAIIGVTVIIICGAVIASLVSSAFDNNNTVNGQTTPIAGSSTVEVPADAVLVSVASSNTKEIWMNNVVERFNQANIKTASGRTVVVSVSHVTSGGSLDGIKDGSLQPIAWSPGDSSWADQVNADWNLRFNKPIASNACQPTVYAPVGFAMWRPMAEALGWPDKPISWDTIIELASDPEGWNNPKFNGNPQWGAFRFGHTHPAYANSGLLALTSFVYGVVDANGQTITASKVYEAEDELRALEQVTAKYGRQAPALLELMVREGPRYLHAAAVPESEVAKFNVERAKELDLILDGSGLAFIFPAEGTIWADHPYCIFDNADWVDAEEAEGAKLFYDFLAAKEQQELAIDNYLRPLDTNLPLRAPMSLENGINPAANITNVPNQPSPDQAVSEAVIDLFQITKRKSTIVVVLDTSGSMQGERIATATSSTVEFLGRLDPNDEVAVIAFSDNPIVIQMPARVGDVVEKLKQNVSNLYADGNTSLYASVCTATELIEEIQAEDIAAGESRLYGIVLLSDGEDTVGGVTENQMFATCLPENPEADGVKVYPIAFGDQADQTVLQRMAAVSGGRMFTADPSSITNVYISISAEQ